MQLIIEIPLVKLFTIKKLFFSLPCGGGFLSSILTKLFEMPMSVQQMARLITERKGKCDQER